VLEQARLRNPKNDELWLAAVRMEQRAERTKEAETLMAKALQDCARSGRLLAEAIAMAPRPQRKKKSSDALSAVNDDPHVIAAVAQLFWNDRKVGRCAAAAGEAGRREGAQGSELGLERPTTFCIAPHRVSWPGVSSVLLLTPYSPLRSAVPRWTKRAAGSAARCCSTRTLATTGRSATSSRYSTAARSSRRR
jgi:hypothetical protein